MIDYTIFYKTTLAPDDNWDERWDLFISAYTDAERVKAVFERVSAKRKLWLVFPEYEFDAGERPKKNTFTRTRSDEAEFIQQFFSTLDCELERTRICIDITGFIRPYLLFLIRWLQAKGVASFDAVYSEPVIYSKREKTEFSPSVIEEVRQVSGYEGEHSTETNKDLLLIASGYDDHLIAKVAESKDHARKVQLFGFPSLRADMFQENVVRAKGAEEAVGGRTADTASSVFAPAYDPFVTAAVIQNAVSNVKSKHGLTNLYISPLATKPQVLGFAVYYLYECANEPASIVFPFSASYSKKTAKGLTRVWKYTVELPTG